MVKYTTVKNFWQHIGIAKHNMQISEPGESPTRENVGSSITAGQVLYFDYPGINADDIELYIGNSGTQLTINTDYTLDTNRSTVTITSAGSTKLSGTFLGAEYGYNSLGNDLTYNQTERILNEAESYVDHYIYTTFSTTDNPDYINIENERKDGGGFVEQYYYTNRKPIIEFTTTTTGTYTGGTALTLTNASGLPNSGILYVGGNKVPYSAKTGNTLTITDLGITIANNASVRGEVVEASYDEEGLETNYEVLQYGVDYDIDYFTGRIKLLDEYYANTIIDYTQPPYGVPSRVRLSYMSAWHEREQDPVIPDEIRDATHMIALKKLVGSTIKGKAIDSRANFEIQSLEYNDAYIKQILNKYKTI